MDEGARETSQPNDRRFFIGLGVVLALVGALFVANYIHNRRASDLRTDELYCTLSGIGPFDRAPNTGRLCGDINLNG